MNRFFNQFFHIYFNEGNKTLPVKEGDYLGWVSKHSTVPMATVKPKSCPDGNLIVMPITKYDLDLKTVTTYDSQSYKGRSSVSVTFSNRVNDKRWCLISKAERGVFHNYYFPSPDKFKCYVRLNDRKSWTILTTLSSIR